MDWTLWYLQVLLSKTFELAFEADPLRPGGAWMIPLCSREMGDHRSYPHFHVIYVQQYGGHMGLAVSLEEGFWPT